MALSRVCWGAGTFPEVFYSDHLLLELPLYAIWVLCYPLQYYFPAFACMLILVGCVVCAVCFACAVWFCVLSLPA